MASATQLVRPAPDDPFVRTDSLRMWISAGADVAAALDAAIAGGITHVYFSGECDIAGSYTITCSYPLTLHAASSETGNLITTGELIIVDCPELRIANMRVSSTATMAVTNSNVHLSNADVFTNFIGPAIQLNADAQLYTTGYVLTQNLGSVRATNYGIIDMRSDSALYVTGTLDVRGVRQPAVSLSGAGIFDSKQGNLVCATQRALYLSGANAASRVEIARIVMLESGITETSAVELSAGLTNATITIGEILILIASTDPVAQLINTNGVADPATTNNVNLRISKALSSGCAIAKISDVELTAPTAATISSGFLH